MLSALVPFQITKLTKSFLAHIALVRFLVRVNTHVVFQSTRVTKTLLAYIALVRFLLRVNTHVIFQSIRMTKSFLAHITFVRFLVRVNTHVSLQMTRLTKSLLAHITLVRFLVRVNSLVPFQMTRCTKTLLAHIALVSLRSLPLHSFLINSRFFFSHLMMIHLEIILLLRNPRAHKHHRGFFFLTLQNRPRVHRSFRTWILSSAHGITRRRCCYYL